MDRVDRHNHVASEETPKRSQSSLKYRVESYGLARKNSLYSIAGRIHNEQYDFSYGAKTEWLLTKDELIGVQKKHLSDLNMSLDTFYEPTFETRQTDCLVRQKRAKSAFKKDQLKKLLSSEHVNLISYQDLKQRKTSSSRVFTSRPNKVNKINDRNKTSKIKKKGKMTPEEVRKAGNRPKPKGNIIQWRKRRQERYDNNNDLYKENSFDDVNNETSCDDNESNVNKDTSFDENNQSFVNKDTSFDENNQSFVNKDTSFDENNQSFVNKETSTGQFPIIENILEYCHEPKSPDIGNERKLEPISQSTFLGNSEIEFEQQIDFGNKPNAKANEILPRKPNYNMAVVPLVRKETPKPTSGHLSINEHIIEYYYKMQLTDYEQNLIKRPANIGDNRKFLNRNKPKIEKPTLVALELRAKVEAYCKKVAEMNKKLLVNSPKKNDNTPQNAIKSTVKPIFTSAKRPDSPSGGIKPIQNINAENPIDIQIPKDKDGKPSLVVGQKVLEPTSQKANIKAKGAQANNKIEESNIKNEQKERKPTNRISPISRNKTLPVGITKPAGSERFNEQKAEKTKQNISQAKKMKGIAVVRSIQLSSPDLDMANSDAQKAKEMMMLKQYCRRYIRKAIRERLTTLKLKAGPSVEGSHKDLSLVAVRYEYYRPVQSQFSCDPPYSSQMFSNVIFSCCVLICIFIFLFVVYQRDPYFWRWVLRRLKYALNYFVY